MSAQIKKWLNLNSRIFCIVVICILDWIGSAFLARFAPTLAAYSDPFFFWLLVSVILALILSRRSVTRRGVILSLVISTLIVFIRFHMLAGTLGSSLAVRVGFDRNIYYAARHFTMGGDYSGTTDYRRRFIFFESVGYSECSVEYAVYGPKLIDNSGSKDADLCTISR